MKKKRVQTCWNMSKRVEMCRNMSKTAFLSWPILISRKSFCIIIPKHFLLFENKKNKTPQAFILVILENEMYKKMKRIFFIIIIITYSWFLSLQLALIVTRKWKKIYVLNHKKRPVHVFNEQFYLSNSPVRFTGTFYG